MFERYSESARRVIFFARYESSTSNLHEIASEHLLLGLCRETVLKNFVSADKLREKIAQPADPKFPTSVDAPLSAESKRILSHAATEADLLGHRVIDWIHLTLGILREPASGAAQWLLAQGLDREKLIGLSTTNTPGTSYPIIFPVLHLQQLVLSTEPALREVRGRAQTDALSEGWTRKQALAHLVDLALATHRWLHLPEPAAQASPPPATTWEDLLELWKATNDRIVAAADQIPEERWTQLKLRLLESYVERTKLVLDQIL
jgi:hypothetical protein